MVKEESQIEELCPICHNDGECPNEDIYDCVEYLEVKEGKRKGQWMIDWMKRLNNKQPYESEFVKWIEIRKRNTVSK